LVFWEQREWVESNPHKVPIIRVDALDNDYAANKVEAAKVIAQLRQQAISVLAERENLILPKELFQ
jgi:hypothetical protein